MNNCYPFYNTPLPYSYNALEPFIDEKTMHLHHDRHLQTYIDSLNQIMEENPFLQNYTLSQLVSSWCCLPCHLQTLVRNNAGGVFNHRFYFEGMKKPGISTPAPRLFHEIACQFGSLEQFQALFKQTTLSVFGSGYVWLVSDNDRLKIIATANQNTPPLTTLTPLLNIDVWEHAYYLKHYNMRSAYIDDWFKVVSWETVECRFSSQKKTFPRSR